jgi:hypothetical protein
LKDFKEEAGQHGNQSQTAWDLGLQLSVLRRWIKESIRAGKRHFPARVTARRRSYGSYSGKSTLKGNRRDPKKGSGYLHQELSVRYQFVREHCRQYSVERLCQAMEISVSGYYAWAKRPESDRKR